VAKGGPESLALKKERELTPVGGKFHKSTVGEERKVVVFQERHTIFLREKVHEKKIREEKDFWSQEEGEKKRTAHRDSGGGRLRRIPNQGKKKTDIEGT